tara:strand:- start:81 stop:224 length:144 start_codon:yes stop_codon:yes gene_type:complete
LDLKKNNKVDMKLRINIEDSIIFKLPLKENIIIEIIIKNNAKKTDFD